MTRINTATCLCLSTMNRISSFMCRRLFYLFNNLAREVIVRCVDIDDIVDYHCFKLHIILTKNQSL